MTIINLAIKMALVNVVVCSRTNGSKESHDYADRMGETVRKAITDNLKHILTKFTIYPTFCPVCLLLMVHKSHKSTYI